jgi:hypothetical protein
MVETIRGHGGSRGQRNEKRYYGYHCQQDNNWTDIHQLTVS